MADPSTPDIVPTDSAQHLRNSAVSATPPRLGTFEAFWPYYVGEHRKRATRALHYVGTSMAIVSAVASIVTRRPSWLIAAPLFGYGPAWIAHFFIEKNRPATFTYPRWSLLADFRMLGFALRGKMASEVAKLDRTTPAR